MSTKNSNPELKDFAQSLRTNMTKEEKHLWYDFLKLLDVTAHRQKVIDNYIVDFCIPSASLIIELDGSQHYEPENRVYDKQRDDYLRTQGYTVVRYTNLEVQSNFDGVCMDIIKHIDMAKKPHPSFASQNPPSPEEKA